MADWFYHQNGQQLGPVDEASLKSMASRGELKPGDLVWREGMPEWVKAAQVPELSVGSGSAGANHSAAVPPAPAAPASAAGQRYTCATCGGMFPLASVYSENGLIICKHCFAERTRVAGQWAAPSPPGYASPHLGYASPDGSSPPRDWITALLLCLFLGGLGIHRFYTGHIAIGIVQLLTAGGCGIWALIDLILIASNSYTDVEGRPLVRR